MFLWENTDNYKKLTPVTLSYLEFFALLMLRGLVLRQTIYHMVMIRIVWVSLTTRF